MVKALLFFLLFCAIFILGAPHGVVHWFIHALCLAFALPFLYKLSKYYLFWFMLLLCLFCASEPRFSIEYYLIAMGFVGWGLSDWWLNLKKRDRAIFFLTSFTLLLITNLTLIGFAERGAHLAWLPIFLGLYFEPSRNRIMYTISGIGLLFSNKVSTVIAFLSLLFNRFKTLAIAFVVLIAMFPVLLLKDGIASFIETSVNSRISIWQSSFQGFLASPIFGHGFKTFALDYPEYKIPGEEWGTHIAQQIAHGHSLFFHYIFELGLVGIILMCVLFYLLYKRAPKALLPFFIVSLLYVPLILFGEFLLASLLLAPFFQKKAEDEHRSIGLIFSQFPRKYLFIPAILVYVVALASFVPSAVGHYYYDQGKFTQAIKWDKQNALYFLARGINRMGEGNKDGSLHDFTKATILAPSVGYMHGYLAASALSYQSYEVAKRQIEEAIRLSGANPYWEFIAALANFKDKDTFHNYFWRATKTHPGIVKEVSDPEAEARMYIGGSKSDVRVLSFHRKGPKFYLPLPYVPDCPTKAWELRKQLLDEEKLKKKDKSQAAG